MQDTPSHSEPSSTARHERGSTRQILTYVYFTSIVYLSIGLPLAILPEYVHLRMGFSAALAGFVISVQYIATFLSRPWAGRISDTRGAKVSVEWGMAMCAASGLTLAAAPMLHLHRAPWAAVAVMMASRLLLGVGESLGSTGATLWGISVAGQDYTAKVISFNGVATYGALALGAPLGVVMEQAWGLLPIGLLTAAIGAVSLLLANRRAPVPIKPGEHLPFKDVLGRVTPHGMGLALGGVGYSVLATFVTLFYASRRWDGAALCLTAFGIAFVLVRLVFLHAISHYGGFRVGITSLIVESLGVLLLWRAVSPWMAAGGAALTGFGFSLVFPALGVEAVKRVPVRSRGTALGVYTVFADVSFFMVGPVAGWVIGAFGYAEVFLFALGCVIAALGIVLVLAARARKSAAGIA